MDRDAVTWPTVIERLAIASGCSCDDCEHRESSYLRDKKGNLVINTQTKMPVPDVHCGLLAGFDNGHVPCSSIRFCGLHSPGRVK